MFDDGSDDCGPLCGLAGSQNLTPQAEWDTLTPTCQGALQTAVPKTTIGGMVASLNRAFAAQSTLIDAVKGTSISWDMLAAVGIRESAFVDKNENDGAGIGVGIFQISVPASGLTASQAGDLTTAASYAANLLNSDMKTLAAEFPGFTSGQLLQATAASYNFGTTNISGNPATIDVGSAPYPKAPGNYGSNIVNLMDCFH